MSRLHASLVTLAGATPGVLLAVLHTTGLAGGAVMAVVGGFVAVTAYAGIGERLPLGR